MSVEAQMPGSQGEYEAGLGWLLQPGWGKGLFGEIAAAKQTTPEVLRALERILAATGENAPPIGRDDFCPNLQQCGTYSCALEKCGLCASLTNRRPMAGCSHLQKCGTFSEHREIMEKELE